MLSIGVIFSATVLTAEWVSYAQGLIVYSQQGCKTPSSSQNTEAVFVQPDSTYKTHPSGAVWTLIVLPFAQALEGEKCCAIHKIVCLPDPCQLGRFPHFISKNKNWGKMPLVVSWIMEALEHSHCTVVYPHPTFQWNAHVKYRQKAVVQLKTENIDGLVTLDEYFSVS